MEKSRFVWLVVALTVAAASCSPEAGSGDRTPSGGGYTSGGGLTPGERDTLSNICVRDNQPGYGDDGGISREEMLERLQTPSYGSCQQLVSKAVRCDYNTVLRWVNRRLWENVEWPMTVEQNCG